MKEEIKQFPLRDIIAEVAAGLQKADCTTPQPSRYVYGIRGIQELFHVSRKTAQDYKKGIIRDACYQHGRKIIVDVDKAMALFKQSKQ